MSIRKLESAFADFVEKPSSANTAALNREITDYPLYWGQAMAEGTNIGRRVAKRVGGTGGYEPEKIDKYVTKDTDGNRLSLIFQRRFEDGTPWHVLSWRSVYPGTNSNRRFYMSADGEPWSTTRESAQAVLEHANSSGWLDDEFIDLRRRPQCDVVDSGDLDAEQRKEYLLSFVVPGESFEDPDGFIVCEDSNESWRKIMILNDGRVTFRSVTTDPEYGVLKFLHNDRDWNLDNSMQDCNVQQARAFLQYLRATSGN